ncbi:MAG: peroxiredoxin family protein [Polyangiales bacterium]
MRFPIATCAIALASLSLTACMVTGDIEGSEPTVRHRDGGPVSGNHPPPDDDAGDDPGSDPAPPPPEDDTGTDDTSAPDGGAPPPPSDDSGAPKPPSDTGPVDPGPTGAYPSGPYAIATGSTYPNVSLNGYKDGAGAWTTIAASDYYDPTGSRGIKAVLVVVSAAWCGPCQEEAKEMPSYKAKYAPQGIRFLEVVIENLTGDPASQPTIDSWKKMASLDVDVAADPSKNACPKGSIGLPFNTLIDAKTMKVIETWSGADTGTGSISAVDDFLASH